MYHSHSSDPARRPLPGLHPSLQRIQWMQGHIHCNPGQPFMSWTLLESHYIYSWQLLNKPYEDLIWSGSSSWWISLISMRSALLRGIWPYFPTSYKQWDGPPNTIHPQSKSFDDLWTASLLRFQDTMPLGCLGFYPIKILWTDKSTICKPFPPTITNCLPRKSWAFRMFWATSQFQNWRKWRISFLVTTWTSVFQKIHFNQPATNNDNKGFLCHLMPVNHLLYIGLVESSWSFFFW